MPQCLCRHSSGPAIQLRQYCFYYTNAWWRTCRTKKNWAFPNSPLPCIMLYLTQMYCFHPISPKALYLHFFPLVPLSPCLYCDKPFPLSFHITAITRHSLGNNSLRCHALSWEKQCKINVTRYSTITTEKLHRLVPKEIVKYISKAMYVKPFGSVRRKPEWNYYLGKRNQKALHLRLPWAEAFPSLL